MPSASRRWILTLLSFVAAVGASLYIVVSTWPAGGVAALPWTAHAAAVAATVLEIAARALKVRLSARALDVPLSFGAALRTCLGGDFAAAITPARSGAEPARFVVLRRAGVAPAPTVLVLFTEIFLELWSLIAVAALLALFFHDAGRALDVVVGSVGGYAAAVLGVGALGLALARRRAAGPPPGWARRIGLGAAQWRALQRLVRQLSASVAAVRAADRRTITLAYVASVAHIALRLLVLPALVLFVRRDVPLAPLLFWPLALVYGAVVSPAPGGGGVVEVAFRAVLGGTIPAALFAPALVWWRFYTFYIYIPLGGLAAGRTVMRALRGSEGARGDSGLERRQAA